MLVPPLLVGNTLSVVTSGSRSATLGGEEEVEGIVGPLYDTPLRVVIALTSPLGLAIVLLGSVPGPEGRSFKDL